jgi:hypothetical protein
MPLAFRSRFPERETEPPFSDVFAGLLADQSRAEDERAVAARGRSRGGEVRRRAVIDRLR